MQARMFAVVSVCLFAVISFGTDCRADVWAVGANSTVLRYDGFAWNPVMGVPAGNYRGIWGSADDDIYIATGGPDLLHFDGVSWNAVPAGGDTVYQYSYYVRDVYGTSADDVYAFGNWNQVIPPGQGVYGCVFHYDGVEWSLHAEYLGETNEKGWASANGWVFALGCWWEYLDRQCYGLLAYMDPWGAVSALTGDYYSDFYSVWGLGSDNVYLTCNDGYFNTVPRFNGASWSNLSFPDTFFMGTPEEPVPSPFTRYPLFASWGTAPDDMFFVGWQGQLMHYGGGWTEAVNIPTGTTEHLRSVSGMSVGDFRLVYAVGDDGAIVEYNGSACTVQPSGTTEDLVEVWVSPIDATDVETPAASITLEQNYPNPFNPSTTIRYSVPEDGAVTLAVYDAAGRRVVTLVDAVKTAGRHTVVWDGRGGSGIPVSSGVYFCRLRAGTERVERKMVLLR